MNQISMAELGAALMRKRGSLGIRATAAEIGTSAATLSRIENGHIPDLATLKKVCDWLGIDIGTVLGKAESRMDSQAQIQIAFKKKTALNPETARSLSTLIMAAHAAFCEALKTENQ